MPPVLTQPRSPTHSAPNTASIGQHCFWLRWRGFQRVVANARARHRVIRSDHQRDLERRIFRYLLRDKRSIAARHNKLSAPFARAHTRETVRARILKVSGWSQSAWNRVLKMFRQIGRRFKKFRKSYEMLQRRFTENRSVAGGSLKDIN
jgi:hypothetical protein